MSEQHLDLFALMARAHVLRCLGDAPRNFALDQTCVHAATQHFVEQPAKQRAVAKTTVAVLGKRRVIGDFIFEA